MGKIAMTFIFLSVSVLLILLLLLILNKETYSTKNYETEKELDIVDTNNNTNLEIPSSNPIGYVYFNDHRRRNQFNIGNEPQSPNENVKNVIQPTCACNKNY